MIISIIVTISLIQGKMLKCATACVVKEQCALKVRRMGMALSSRVNFLYEHDAVEMVASLL